MKVTPLAGSGLGAVTSGNGTASPDRREAAKLAFLGQTGTTVAQVEKPEDENLRNEQANERNIRKIRMKTNASPDRFLNEEPVTEEIPAETNAESIISDSNTQAVETEVTRPISPQFAELARRQRALQVKEREITEKERALSEKASASQGIEIEKIKANPLAVLQQAGVTYEQLTEAILAEQAGVSPEVQALKNEIAELKSGIDTKFTERDSQVEKQAVAQIHKDVEALVAQGDDFELIRGQGYQRKVTDLIHKNWKATGEVLDVHEAAVLIEQELEKDAIKYASFKKVQSKLTPAEETPQTPAQQTTQLRTLTNRQTASPQMSAKARAIAAFNGHKK